MRGEIMKKILNFVNEISKKNEKKLTIILFVLLFFFGFLFIGNVGFYNDEGSEQNILKMNIYEYSKQFGEDNDLAIYFKKNGFTPISLSVERDHGIAPYYLFAPFLTLDKVSPNLLSNAWHFYTYLLTFLGVIFFYLLCKTLFKKKSIALLSTLMFFFTPKLFIDSLYNNKDAVLMSFSIMTLYFGVKFIKNKDYKSAILFGLISAFTCNIKISGIFVFCMIGFCYLLILTLQKKWSKKTFAAGLLAIISCSALYLLITPAIWGSGFNLLDFAKWCLTNSTKFSRWNGNVLFEGIIYNHITKPIPWYYLPKMIVITIPIFITVLAILSFVLFIYKTIKMKKIDTIGIFYLTIVLIVIIPVFIAMISHPNIYNGWRHFYFLYGPIVLISGFGIYYSSFFKWSKFLKIIILTLVLINFVIICFYGVFCTCYYNVLAGDNITKKYELNNYSAASRAILKDIVDNNRGCDSDRKCYISTKNSIVEGEITSNYNALPLKYRKKIVLVNEKNYKKISSEKKIIYYVNPTIDSNDYNDYKKIYEKKVFNYSIYYLYVEK